VRLKKARADRDWTQEELVEELKTHGSEEALGLRSYQKIEETGECNYSILTVLANMLEVPLEELLDQGQEPWTMPTHEWDPHLDPPGALLRAEMGIVPFHLRSEELDDLKRWCNENRSISLRLVVGAGGMGKTRLALKLCREMQDEAWRTGFIDYLAFRTSEEEVWASALRDPAPLLLVFDYAETHGQELGWVLSRIYSCRPARVRILLLSRSAGEWWDRLQTERVVGDLVTGPATCVHSLRPLTQGIGDRQASHRRAAEAFARKLGKSVPAELGKDLADACYERVLLLHMDALLAVEGVQARSERKILEAVLNREERFWNRHLEARGLPQTLLEGIRQTMAGVTYLDGVATREDGLALLGALPFFEGQTAADLSAINRLLHDCYPGDQWIEPVQPDLLGDQLYARTFADARVRKAVFALVTKAAGQRDSHAGT